LATVVELEARAGDQITDSAGDKDLSGLGLGRHPRPDVDSDASHRVPSELDLTRVQTGPHLEAQRSDRVADRTRAADRPRGPVEDREDAVAGSVDLPSMEPLQLSADRLVVRLEELAPPPVTERRRLLCRADDVREEHCHQYTIRLAATTNARQEVLDLVEDLVGVEPWNMIFACELDEPRFRNAGREVSPFVCARVVISPPVEHKRRDAYCAEDVPHVDLAVHQDQIPRGAG